MTICGRCYEEVEYVVQDCCNEKPELLREQPLGMYHCPDCGAMLLAGLMHPLVCQRCADNEHPAFDTIDS